MQAQTNSSSAASDSNHDDKPLLNKESLRPLSVFQGDKAAWKWLGPCLPLSKA